MFGKDVLLSVLNDTTAILDHVDASQTRPSDIQVQHTISAYDKLLFFPVEYMSRTSRTDLVRRALTADVVISSMSIDKNNPSSYYCRSITVLRTFLKRVFVYLGAVDYPVSYTPFLLLCASFPVPQMQATCEFLGHMLNTSGSPTIEFSLVTLDLIEIHIL